MSAKQKAPDDSLLFVVQKHATVRPHYDFRLQVGNVMPSWSIPKGPTLDPTIKRMAMETTDHDLDYRTFEGIIPEGEYGAGAVMIWDKGWYEPEEEQTDKSRITIEGIKNGTKIMKEEIKKGEIKFKLHGKRLKGSFALVKTKGFGPKNAWLMIKHKDEAVKEGFDAAKETKSVKSGKTIEEIT